MPRGPAYFRRGCSAKCARRPPPAVNRGDRISHMKIKGLTPILNVSNIVESFAWFAKLGWEKGWDWGDPPTFGGICNGKAEIFLCQNGQGSRGGPMPQFVGNDETGAVWMSWWLESPAAVDEAYKLAVQNELTVTMPPTTSLGTCASFTCGILTVTRFA